MSNRIEISIEDAMDAIIDYRGKTPTKTSSGVPLVTAKIVKGGRIDTPTEFIADADFESWMRRGMPKAGDIVITTEAPLGEVAQLDGRRIALAQRLICLRGKPGLLDNDFLKFLLMSSEVQARITARASGTTVVGIRQSELRRVLLPLPPIEEQRNIAAVLGTLDDKIEQNRRTGSKLEGLARGVFKAWFVDFEPVKAKAAGATAFPGMPPETFAALPTRFTNSELGPVPQGWEQATLRELAEFITGGTPSKQEPAYWGGDFPWVSAKDMHGRIVSDSELRLTDAGRGSVRRLAPRHATLMVIRGMSLMTEVRIGWCTREVAFNQDLRAFIARDGIPPEFIHLWLTSSEEQLMQMVDTASHGTGRILTDRLDSMTIAQPGDAVMRAFADVSRPIMALRETLHTESAKLAALRDYLLPRLLSGRVRVEAVSCSPELKEAS